MDTRWQPDLGPVAPEATPEACALLAAGWRAEAQECRITSGDGPPRLVSLETWRALRDRWAFLRPRQRMQR